MITLPERELKWLEGFCGALGLLAGGSLSQALPSLENLSQSAKLQFGPEHGHTTAALSALAAAYLHSKKIESAARAFQEARYAADLALEQWACDILLAASFSGLAGVLVNQKSYEDALLHCQKAISLAARDSAAVALGAVSLNLTLAQIHYLQEQYAKAAQIFVQAAEAFMPHIQDKEDYMRLAQMHAQGALANYWAGEIREAQKSLEAVLNLRESCELEQASLFVACINFLATIYREQGNPGSADTYLDWGLETCLEVYGMESSTGVCALNFAANHYFAAKDWSKASDYLKDGVQYVDKKLEAEDAMWMLHKLVTISAMQNDLRSQDAYERILADIYFNQYTGNYLSDKALVENGDQGAAAKRQQKFHEALAKVQAKYDTKLHPLVVEVLGAPDAVWSAPTIAMCRAYLLRYLDEHAPCLVPEQTHPGSTDSTGARAGIKPDVATDANHEHQEEDWMEKISSHISEGNHAQALTYVGELMHRVMHTEGSFSRELFPLFNAVAAIYEAKGESIRAQTARLRAQLLAMRT